MIRLRATALEPRTVPATFYVAVTGSDANAGTSTAPWATLEFAADKVKAGDTVIVRPGDYAGFYLTADGTPNAPITFRGEAGARVTSPNLTTPDGINLEGADWVVIEGFQVLNAPRAGIRSVINTNAVIRDNVCTDNARWGIFTGFSENLLIENNHCTGSTIEHGIYVSNSADNPVVRGNRVWNNSDSGIQLNADVFAGGDGIITNALIENNVIFNNGAGGGAAINLDGVQNSVIRNNLLYNNRASGIALFRENGAEGSKNNLVINNTIRMPDNGRWAVAVLNASSGNQFANNIFTNEHSFRGAINASSDSLPGLKSNFNAVANRFSIDGGNSTISLTAWKTATGGQDANSATTTAAAVFASAADDQYWPALGGSAVDTGTAVNAPAVDLEGTPRPSRGGTDIGAFELANAPVVAGTTIDAGTPQRSVARSVSVQFGGEVELKAGAFVLSPPVAGLSVTATTTAGQTTALVTFTGSALEGGSLPDGDYTLTVVASQVRETSSAGVAMAANAAVMFHRLFGDADGDRAVTFVDFLAFRSAFGGASPVFDIDGDGLATFTDFLAFRSRFGTTLP